jgi:hypothetical protein
MCIGRAWGTSHGRLVREGRAHVRASSGRAHGRAERRTRRVSNWRTAISVGSEVRAPAAATVRVEATVHGGVAHVAVGGLGGLAAKMLGLRGGRHRDGSRLDMVSGRFSWVEEERMETHAVVSTAVTRHASKDRTVRPALELRRRAAAASSRLWNGRGGSSGRGDSRILVRGREGSLMLGRSAVNDGRRTATCSVHGAKGNVWSGVGTDSVSVAVVTRGTSGADCHGRRLSAVV